MTGNRVHAQPRAFDPRRHPWVDVAAADAAAIARAVRRCPSVAPFVSDGEASLDVLADDSWLPDRHRPLLHGAHRFRQELGTHSSVPAVCIFGYGIKTIAGASVERGTRGEVARATFRFDDGGDGMIPQQSAILPGAEIHPVRQQHGSLYADDDVRMRLKLELTRPLGAVPA